MESGPKPSRSSEAASAEAWDIGAAVSTDERRLRRRADGIRSGQVEALELALSGCSLPEVLQVLVRTLEVQSQGEVLAAVVWLEGPGAPLQAVAGNPVLQALHPQKDETSRPSPWRQAMLTGQPVGDESFDRADSAWPAVRSQALLQGLQSCWARPVVLPGSEVAGALVLYRRSAGWPPLADRQAADELAHTAAVAISAARERAGREADEKAHREELLRLAHDLRNPLAPVRNSLELLERKGDDAGIRDRAGSIISRQVSQMARIVDDLARLAHEPAPPGGARNAPAAAEPAVDWPADSGGPSAEGSWRILVADDNDLVRESFVELLCIEGYEVRTAVDGLQAIEVAEAWHPQVVLLDIHMPRLSGLETARRLRANHSPQSMTLLMMSGMTLNDAWVRHAKAAGFDDCLDKTTDPRHWLSRLREAVTTHRH